MEDKNLEAEIIEEETDLVVKEESKLEVRREILDWDKMMGMAEFLSKSTIIPVQYQNRSENILIAIDLASRMGVSVLALMQSLYIINGKPSLSGQAIASLIRSSGQFTNVELHYTGEPHTDSWGAFVTAERNGKLLKGAEVTVKMAKAEGWYQKNGSKWQTLTELMLSYRSYTYFARMYAPEILLGLHVIEEVEDMGGKSETKKVVNPFD